MAPGIDVASFPACGFFPFLLVGQALAGPLAIVPGVEPADIGHRVVLLVLGDTVLRPVIRRFALRGVDEFFVIGIGHFIQVDVKCFGLADVLGRLVVPALVGTHDEFPGVHMHHAGNVPGSRRCPGLGGGDGAAGQRRWPQGLHPPVRPLAFGEQKRARFPEGTQSRQRQGALMAGAAFGLFRFFGASLLQLFRQVAGGVAGQFPVRRILQKLERRSG